MGLQTLVASGTGVAVTSTETTLLDWTEAGGLGSFLLWVKNAGGGSGDAILTVTLYGAPTASGAGSVSIDASTIAAVASGNTEMLEVTKSLPYIKVTAVCDTAEDTTADFWVTRKGFESSSV